MNVLTERLALHQAREAARAGDLDEAGRMLDELDAEPSAAVLDLRARVHAQRGELSEADRCWARVQELSPDDVAAAAGRRTIEKILAGRRLARPAVTAGRVSVVASVMVLVMLSAGTTWLVVDGSERTPHLTVSADQQQLQAETKRANTLQARLDSLDADHAAASNREAHALDVIAGRLAMTGVTAQRRADDVQVVFNVGLFPSDVELSRTGETLLTDIGRRLAGLDVWTTVVGHAVAVPGGPASGGSMVALERAEVAAQRLAAAGALPLTAFTLASADQTDGPFSDASRNRTVTLLVRLKQS